jgi:hypothetical protein
VGTHLRAKIHLDGKQSPRLLTDNLYYKQDSDINTDTSTMGAQDDQP